MAKSGQTIDNPVTGQRILFLTSAQENNGTRWEVEWFIQPRRGRFPPAHQHPLFSERFTILAGLARYQLGGQECAAGTGEVVDLPAAIAHQHPWNVGDDVLHMHQVFELPKPDLRALQATEAFFETLFGLARDGKVGGNGLPNPLQFVVLAQAGAPLTYAPGIPIALQAVAFGALAAVGRSVGYQARYPQYSETARLSLARNDLKISRQVMVASNSIAVWRRASSWDRAWLRSSRNPLTAKRGGATIQTISFRHRGFEPTFSSG